MNTLSAQRIVWAFLRLLLPHEIANLRYHMEVGTRFARPRKRVQGTGA
jgi:hypothetical protein